MTFIEVARERGLKPKLFYSINEVAQVTGIQERDIRAEVNAGRLKAKVPLGKERGLCIKPEWVDSWADATD
ncbi:DNA-binding protein [Collinsella tanakaei]|uniref:DNA-binding protein n=1 Tax=Collinsella tanakaei TaxID=626935 RepID=UPI0022E46D4B|nr:DNA-binding protein [Collinsella tanakaei]